MAKTSTTTINILDSCAPNDVVYCREREGRFGITTTARFMYKQERTVVDEETGKEKTVIDYYLWDLRYGKVIQNPTTAWKNAEQYFQLRNEGKVKLVGDVVAEDEKKIRMQKAVTQAA